MKRLFLALVFAVIAQTAAAQTNITASDPSTLQRTQVGDFGSHAIRTFLVNSVGNPFGTSSNPIRVDPTGTTTQPVSIGGTLTVQGTVGATQGTAAAASGRWPVYVTDGVNTLPTGDAAARALHISQDQISGTTVSVNSGTKDAGTQRFVLATDQPNLTTALNINWAQIAGTAVSVNSGNKDAGTQRVVIATDQPNLTTPLNTNTTQLGSVVLAGADASGYQLEANVATATTTGGTSRFYWPATASTNAQVVKNSAGNVYAVLVQNTTSTIYYLRMYNLAAAPTCSSATGFVETIIVPHATGTGAQGGYSLDVPDAYSTGIAFCITGGPTSTDNTNAAAGVFATVKYKD